jgi:hypothetical protein
MKRSRPGKYGSLQIRKLSTGGSDFSNLSNRTSSDSDTENIVFQR